MPLSPKLSISQSERSSNNTSKLLITCIFIFPDAKTRFFSTFISGLWVSALTAAKNTFALISDGSTLLNVVFPLKEPNFIDHLYLEALDESRAYSHKQ